MIQKIPLVGRRFLVKNKFVGEIVLASVFRENLGRVTKKEKQKFLKEAESTAPVSTADTNYVKEIEKNLPENLRSLKGKPVFIYGELDRQKGTLGELTEGYLEVPRAGHGVFRYRPKKALEVLRKIID